MQVEMRKLEVHEVYHGRGASISQETVGAMVMPERIVPVYRPKPVATRSKVTKTVTLNSGLLLLSLIVSYSENQHYYSNSDSEDEIEVALRTILMLFSLAQITLISKYFLVVRKLEVSRKLRVTSTVNAAEMRWIWLEVAYHCCTIPPYINHVWTFHQLGTKANMSLSDMSFLTQFLRFKHWLRFLVWKSRFTDERSFLHIRLQCVSDYSPFINRSMFKLYPIAYLLGLWTLVTLACAFCLVVVERGVTGSRITGLYDSIWSVIVPQATIGYGDFTPVTHLGRLIILLAVFIGIALLSSLLLIVEKILMLSQKESKVFRIMVHSKAVKEQMTVKSAVLIQRWWRMKTRKGEQLHKIRLIFSWNDSLCEFARRHKMIKTIKDVPFHEDLQTSGPLMEGQLSSLRVQLTPIYVIKPIVLTTQASSLLTNEFTIAHKTKMMLKGYTAIAWKNGLETASRRSSGILPKRRSQRHSSTISEKLQEIKHRKSALKRLRQIHKDDIVSVLSFQSRRAGSSQSQDD